MDKARDESELDGAGQPLDFGDAKSPVWIGEQAPSGPLAAGMSKARASLTLALCASVCAGLFFLGAQPPGAAWSRQVTTIIGGDAPVERLRWLAALAESRGLAAANAAAAGDPAWKSAFGSARLLPDELSPGSAALAIGSDGGAGMCGALVSRAFEIPGLTAIEADSRVVWAQAAPRDGACPSGAARLSLVFRIKQGR